MVLSEGEIRMKRKSGEGKQRLQSSHKRYNDEQRVQATGSSQGYE
jgi:hypothetical protein